ncbi:MAG: DUF1810 domain-containing protein [Novosphingobium sp.]|nr:DUF1810 domain-containing protein [Novosphingobium sp.]MCP5403897.1 DUF1810 domain-containing protein [Novosphingobium sp.]
MSALDRFITAQETTYTRALAELRDGAKHSHWMWFIFPQIAGLGRSSTAQYYAIADLDEAKAYLAHPVLGPRLAECTDAMLSWAGRREAEAILGPVDTLKFASSMTLFEAAGGGDSFGRALDGFFSGRRDPMTLALLGSNGQDGR